MWGEHGKGLDTQLEPPFVLSCCLQMGKFCNGPQNLRRTIFWSISLLTLLLILLVRMSGAILCSLESWKCYDRWEDKAKHSNPHKSVRKRSTRLSSCWCPSTRWKIWSRGFAVFCQELPRREIRRSPLGVWLASCGFSSSCSDQDLLPVLVRVGKTDE